ncbi:MAG: FH2 domain-containing protein [Thermocaproicibacter melissae]|jgi:hypothetical protein|uniref:hypothetical protein n=1 Tax=Thermocaproicibacter melissae TaxID=2966552 RepID=UPI003A0FE9A0
MDDISSRLSEILSDPASMERLRNLAAMFSGTSQQDHEPQPAPPPQQNTQRAQPQPQGQMPSLDPQVMGLVMKLAPVLSAMRQEDNSTRLLNALRPFLGEDRRRRLDEAMRILQLARILPYLRNSGLLQSIL